MIEYDVIACPVCHKEISVGFIQQKRITYIVEKDCHHCETNADKIENMLNKSSSRGSKVKTERSYIKLDPRG